jgi:hypothetical protein
MFNRYTGHRFFVRRTPRARHGACDHLRPGRLRAGHAVCLRCSTLEPVICARKNRNADTGSLSTTRTITEQSLAMRGPTQNKNSEAVISRSTDSRFHALSNIPPRSQSNPNKRRTMALQRTAPGGACLSRRLLPPPPFHHHAAGAPASPRPPQSLSLGSLGVLAYLS